jgi:hypothetical protein
MQECEGRQVIRDRPSRRPKPRAGRCWGPCGCSLMGQRDGASPQPATPWRKPPLHPLARPGSPCDSQTSFGAQRRIGCVPSYALPCADRRAIGFREAPNAVVRREFGESQHCGPLPVRSCFGVGAGLGIVRTEGTDNALRIERSRENVFTVRDAESRQRSVRTQPRWRRPRGTSSGRGTGIGRLRQAPRA